METSAVPELSNLKSAPGKILQGLRFYKCESRLKPIIHLEKHPTGKMRDQERAQMAYW